MKYVIGFLAIGLGILMVVKTEWFLENFGANAWAEEHLGSNGGSRLMYKLIGLVFIVGAVLGMTGLLGAIILGIFGPLFGMK